MPKHLGGRYGGVRGDGYWLEGAVAKIAAVGVEVVTNQSGLSFGAQMRPSTWSFGTFGAGHSGPTQSLSL